MPSNRLIRVFVSSTCSCCQRAQPRGDHPHVALSLNNLAALLQDTSRLVEAEPWYRRAVEVVLRTSIAAGRDHPRFKLVVDNYVEPLRRLGGNDEEIRAALDALAKSHGVQT